VRRRGIGFLSIETTRFVRAIFKNAGTNQPQTKLIEKNINNGTNQAELKKRSENDETNRS
jgi:tripartite-type tricarboxylate transporter receptor subunit TctC